MRTFHSATRCCSSVVEDDEEDDFLCWSLRNRRGEGEGLTFSGEGGTDGRRRPDPEAPRGPTDEDILDEELAASPLPDK